MKAEHQINSLIITIARHLKSEYQTQQQCIEHAWDLLQKLTQQTQTELIAQDKLALTQHQQQQLQTWIDAIVQQHMPIQYILSSVPFDDITIFVKPPILIPRPETEYWCMEIIQQLKALKNKQLTILDLCAGSGCIALAFAKAFPQATVYASDISQQAIDLAYDNAAYNNVSNVTLLLSDLFQNIPNNLKFDLIISNPPYIAESEWADLDPSVTQWEDKRALISGPDGLTLIKKIITQASRWLRNNTESSAYNIPQLVIEIGEKQGTIVKQYMKEAGFVNVEIKKDLTKRDRYVCGRVAYDQTSLST